MTLNPEVSRVSQEQATPGLFELNVVTSMQEVDPGGLGLEPKEAPARIAVVDTFDPYLARLPEITHQQVYATEARYDDFARTRREQGMWKRLPRKAYVDTSGQSQQDTRGQWGDPVSKTLFYEEIDSEAWRVWDSLLPSASALAFASDPESIRTITDGSGVEHVIDPTMQAWLTAATDPRGIRSRGSVMAHLAREYVLSSSVNKDDVRWLSVACGTALPAMQGAMMAGIHPRLNLLDQDLSAMSSTQDLAQQIGFEGEITMETKQSKTGEERGYDIFNHAEMREYIDELTRENRQPDLVDAMGIFEYTGPLLRVDSSQFLRDCYDVLKPGGRLLFGQMRSDRPRSDFLMGVLGWPYVQQRSLQELMQVVVKADINPQEASIYLPADGVYMVAAIDKPLA